jgi:hypothetical protein
VRCLAVSAENFILAASADGTVTVLADPAHARQHRDPDHDP